MNRDFWHKRPLRSKPHIHVFELENNHRNIIIDYDGKYEYSGEKAKKALSTVSPGFLLSILFIIALGLATGYLLYKIWMNL
jgi:hypothetical protein